MEKKRDKQKWKRKEQNDKSKNGKERMRQDWKRKRADRIDGAEMEMI